MKKFNNTILLLSEGVAAHIGGYLQANDDVADKVPPTRDLYDSNADAFEGTFIKLLADLDIPMTLMAAKRYVESLRKKDCALTLRQVQDGADEVRARFHDEVEARGQFFYIPMARAKHFEAVEPFGSQVSKKFPKLTEDIQEAHKCFACGRFTACIFHLMRIMETAVRRLGKKLDVSIDVETQTWQIILNHVTAAIKPMDHKLPQTKKFAEVSSHLYNVKVAWRNEVMHPKATYTEEEADMLLTQVGIFMKGLAKIV